MRSRAIDELVEEHVRRWEIERRTSTSRARLPCVALSRLPATGAAELGQRVADQLDYSFFDIQIVDHIARERGIQRRLVEELDEHVRSGVDRYVMDLFRRPAITESDYLSFVARALATLGEGGLAVILGRGAPFVLPPERTLRVLVVASEQARAQRAVAGGATSREQAAEWVRRQDAQRLEFLRQFGVNPDDSALYDLVVNTETLGVAAGADLVVRALRQRFPGDEARRPSG